MLARSAGMAHGLLQIADNWQMTIRLNKYIAETGFCSRREADRLIGERRVPV
ncbi:S4 domain-containing protein, partial [Xanthomonas perforans]